MEALTWDDWAAEAKLWGLNPDDYKGDKEALRLAVLDVARGSIQRATVRGYPKKV